MAVNTAYRARAVSPVLKQRLTAMGTSVRAAAQRTLAAEARDFASSNTTTPDPYAYEIEALPSAREGEGVYGEKVNRRQRGRRFNAMKLAITICLLSLTLPAVVSLLSNGAVAMDHPVRTFASRVYTAATNWAKRAWWLGVALVVVAVLSKVPPFIALTPALIATQKATALVGLSFPLSMPIPFVPPFVNLGFWGVFFLVCASSAEDLARATTRALAADAPSAAWEWWAPAPMATVGVTAIAPKPLVLPLALTALALTNLFG